jgi:hypothetical protein
MSTHDSGTGRPDAPAPDDRPDASDEATRWTVPSGPAISPLPPVDPSAAYETPPGRPSAIRRWLLPLVGLVFLALIAAALIFVVLNMQPTADGGASRAGYQYLSDRSMMAVELRLDLPGDQREQLFSFISRFPNMGDAAAVEQRLTGLVDEAVADMTDGSGSYRDDVEPWFEGWLVAGAQVPADLMRADDGAFVAVMGSRDRTRASEAMLRLRPAGDWTVQPGPGDHEIWVGRDRFGGGDMNAYTVTDDAVVVGASADNVRRALEVKAGSSPNLLEVGRFSDALGRQPVGRMAMFWIDAEALQDSLDSIPGGAAGTPFECDQLPSPRGMAGSMYMRDGRAIVDVVMEMPEGTELPQVRDSGLAQHMPADTFLFLDTRDVGDSASKAIDCLRQNPMFASQLRDIEEGMGQPIDQLISWAGDVGIGLRYDGNRATGGLVIRVTDQGRAAESMGQLRALITALGEGEVTVRDEDYHGARMVTFELGDELDDMAEPPLPTASLAYAFKDDLLVIGVDASFARAVIDAQPDLSLASSAAYRQAIEVAGGATNAGQAYVAIGGAMTFVDAAMEMTIGGDLMDEQMGDFREFMASIESLAVVSTVDGQTTLSRMVLSTRQP